MGIYYKDKEVISFKDISFIGMLAITFIALKLTHTIQWSWIWVLAPLWVPVVFIFFLFVFFFIIILIDEILKKKRLKNKR